MLQHDVSECLLPEEDAGMARQDPDDDQNGNEALVSINIELTMVHAPLHAVPLNAIPGPVQPPALPPPHDGNPNIFNTIV